MNQEKFPIPNVSAEQVVDLIIRNGVEDTGVINLVLEWMKSEEEKVPNDPLAMIQFNLKRARLYAAAGCFEEAFENFNAAREQAFNENRQELYDEIMKEMDRLEDSFSNTQH